MKSLHVEYNQATSSIGTIDDASPESWDAVCQQFDNDVRRIKDVSEPNEYTALYACYDEDNQPVYYLVEEGESLTKMRQKNFLSKLGRQKE